MTDLDEMGGIDGPSLYATRLESYRIPVNGRTHLDVEEGLD